MILNLSYNNNERKPMGSKRATIVIKDIFIDILFVFRCNISQMSTRELPEIYIFLIQRKERRWSHVITAVKVKTMSQIY